MKRARTLFWSLALAASVAALVLQLGGSDDPSEHVEHSETHEDAKPDLLLPEGLARARTFEIVRAERVYRFERDAADRWFWHDHASSGLGREHRHASKADHGHADPPDRSTAIERAFATFERARIERVVAQGLDGKRDEFGLTRPEMLVIVYGEAAKPLLTLQAGALAPDGLSRYVGLVERDVVAILPDYQVSNLVELTAGLVPRKPRGDTRRSR